MNNYYVTAFYKFLILENPEQAQKDLETKAQELNIKGLVILGREGFNSTCAAVSLESLEIWKVFICEYFKVTDVFFKDSASPKAPFRRFKIKIREEIVTTGIPEIAPPEGKNHHLSPLEWNKVLKEENDFVMIDTRNWYEFKIGTFKGALNPNIEKFTDFPEYIEAQGIQKDKKMLIFCTGGIRCEKGILELQKQGYENV
ncbi:MAG TPA: rhodanese-like domain-containing protein, partial [Pseudobdellovibrionaceae bacterium]